MKHGLEITVRFEIIVFVSVVTCDENRILVSILEGYLGTNDIFSRMIEGLGSHTLGSVYLPNYHLLLWLICQADKKFFILGAEGH